MSRVSRRAPTHPPGSQSGQAAAAYLLTPSTSPLPAPASGDGAPSARGLTKQSSWTLASAPAARKPTPSAADSSLAQPVPSFTAGGGSLKTHEITPTSAGDATVCCLYLVAGLPKQTATWTSPSLSSDPSLSKLQHRPGAVGEWWRAEALGSNVSSAVSSPGGSVADDADEGRGKLCGKALKYSFPREVEILRSPSQPASTTHLFSFAVEPPAHSVGRTSGLRSPESDLYHGVTLTIYSLADETKRAAIKKAFANVSAATAASTRFTGTGGSAIIDDRGDYWLPYALTLLSRYPVYSLMADYLKLSWAKFSKDVGNHSRQMTLVLRTPVPRHGGLIRLLISDPAARRGEEDAIELLAPLPELDLNLGLHTVGWDLWPLFKVLSLDHVLAVLEIALSKEGKVVLVSAYPGLLGSCVLTLKYLCELRGSWPGLAQPLVHARDVSLYVEDQGPYILGLDVESKYVVKLGLDVCVVDLDINFVSCSALPAGLFTRPQRDKMLAKLHKAFGESHQAPGGVGVPREFMEAYPGGRMKPFCETRAPSGYQDALSDERVAVPEWWDQAQVLQAFDELLAACQKKPGFFRRLSSGSLPKLKPLTESERIGRVAMRRRALQFIDSRDEMEGKLGRLSRRLAFLVHETDCWKERFTQFEALTEKLGLEADDLKTRIEKERRESRRLSGQLGDREKERDQLQRKLAETEGARAKALEQMSEMTLTMKRIEMERDSMVANLDSQLDSALVRLSTDVGSPSLDGVPSPGSISPSPTLRKYGEGSAPPVSRQASLLSRDSGGDASNRTSVRSDVKHKRFSAMAQRSTAATDPLGRLDDQISAQSDVVEDKMTAIQLKLTLALESITAHHARISIDGRDVESSTSDCSLGDRDDPHAAEPTSQGTATSSADADATRQRASSTIQKGLSAISALFTAPPGDDAQTAAPETHGAGAGSRLSTLTATDEAYVSADEGHALDDDNDDGVASDETHETVSSFYSDEDTTLHHPTSPAPAPAAAAPLPKSPPYTRPPSTTAVGGPSTTGAHRHHAKADSGASAASSAARTLKASASDDSDLTAVGGGGASRTRASTSSSSTAPDDRFTPVFVSPGARKAPASGAADLPRDVAR